MVRLTVALNYHQLQLDPIRTLVLPKIHSAQDLNLVSRQIYGNLQSTTAVNKQRSKPLQIVASVESAKALFYLGEIASWQSEFGPMLGGQLVALLVRFTRSTGFCWKVLRSFSLQRKIVRLLG